MVRKYLAIAFFTMLLVFAAGCGSVDVAPLRSEVQTENDLMAELGAYVATDASKSVERKNAEMMRIKAHLALFNSLIQDK